VNFTKFRNWFDLVWLQEAKSMKQIIKQKIRKETAQKKKEKRRAPAKTGPCPGPRTSPAGLSPQPPFLPLSFSFLFF
jgi:hypothetical protein